MDWNENKNQYDEKSMEILLKMCNLHVLWSKMYRLQLALATAITTKAEENTVIHLIYKYFDSVFACIFCLCFNIFTNHISDTYDDIGIWMVTLVLITSGQGGAFHSI